MLSMFYRLKAWLAGSPKNTDTYASGTEAIAFNDQENIQNVVPYDENLLERSRTQWQFGDWASLAAISRDTLQHHPDRAKLALLTAAGHQALGNAAEARQHARLAMDWGCSKRLVSQILISGAYNTLGRAAAVSGQGQRALKHFGLAIAVGTQGSDARLITQARVNEQYSQLGFGSRDGHTKPDATSIALVKPNVSKSVEASIEQSLADHPDDPVMLIAYAENAMLHQQYDEAIRRWQHLAAVLGKSMPKSYYDRLNQAYLSIESFPLASTEEEFLKGDKDKYILLAEIHERLQPTFYLEIGVQTGKSLSIAKNRALGVDPMPQISYKLNNSTQIIEATSDSFFSENAVVSLASLPDMVFIDGMHLFEFVLRDFINVELYSHSGTLAILDDIFPAHPSQAKRDRKTRAWTGDVWKIKYILAEYRPDLRLQMLDAYPTGLLLVSGMDSTNRVLHDSYAQIVARYLHEDMVPAEVIARKESWSCNDSRIDVIIYELLKYRRTR